MKLFQFGKKKKEEPAKDNGKPLTNPELVKLLNKQRFDQGHETMNALYEEIALRAKFLVPVTFSEEPKDNGDGTATFEKGAALNFAVLKGSDGNRYLTAFTDWDELGKWEQMEKPKTMVMDFDDLAEMTEKSKTSAGVVINAFDQSLVMTNKQIAHMKNAKNINTRGIREHEIKAGTQVLLAEPKDYPTEMTEAISALLKQNAEVKRAWLRLLMNGEETSLLLVVEYTGPDYRSLFDSIYQAANPFSGGQPIDMVLYGDGFGKQATQDCTPFYEA